MIQQPAQRRLTLNLFTGPWRRGITKGDRNNIADSLVRALGVMMSLDGGQRAAQVGFTQQNQIVKRLTDFPDVTFRVRVAQRRLRGRLEDAELVGF